MKKAARTSSSKAKKARKKVVFLQKPACSTCRKARAFMERRGYELNARDLGKDRLTPEELEKLIGPRDHTDFLNTRNEVYRTKKMKDNPPSRKDAIRMMAAEPNLIRRPIIIGGGRVVIGFDEEGMVKL